MGATACHLAQVAGKGADVGSFRTQDVKIHHGVPPTLDFEAVDLDLDWAEPDVLALSRSDISLLAIDLLGTECGGQLVDVSSKVHRGLTQRREAEPVGGSYGNQGHFEVMAVGVRAEGDVPVVGLVLCAELRNALGHAPRAQHEHTCCEGVQRTCMADFDLLEPATAADQVTDLVDDVE